MAPLSCLVTLVVSRFKRNPVVVTWYEVWRGYWHQYLGFLGYGGQFVEWLVAGSSCFAILRHHTLQAQCTRRMEKRIFPRSRKARILRLLRQACAAE